MTIYVVNDEMGGQLDSAWEDKQAAVDRRDALNNSESGFELQWIVTSVHLTTKE